MLLRLATARGLRCNAAAMVSKFAEVLRYLVDLRGRGRETERERERESERRR